MAQKVELQFEGKGTFADDLAAMAASVRQLRDANAKAQEEIQKEIADSGKSAQQFSKAVADTTKVVTSLGKAVAASNTSGFVKNIESAATATGALDKEVKAVAASTGKASDELEQIAKSAASASNSGKNSLTGLSQAAVKSQKEIAASLGLSVDQYEAIREEVRAVGIESEEFTQSIAEAVAELAAAGVQAEDLGEAFEPATESVTSLQRQLRAAKQEAGALAAEFGIDSAQAIEAQKRVAALADEVGDLGARFEAFNPDKKLEAFNQLSFSLQSGLFAVQSTVGLIAGDNEGLNKVLNSFQVLLFTTQGLQQFIGGFGDSLKTLRATLGLTSTATATQTAATAASATATAAAGTAAAASTTGFAAATAAVKAFTISLVTNPIFLVVAALAALGVAVLASGDDAEKANKQWDDFLATIREFQEIDDASREFGAELQKLDIERRRTLLKDGDVQGQKKLIEELRDVEIAAIEDRARARRELADQLESDLNREVNLGKLTQEETDRRETEIAAIRREGASTYNEVTLIKRRADLEVQQNDKEALEAARSNVKARKALVEELVAAERDLAKRLLDAQREAAGQDDPFERVRIERTVAQEEIDELERGFQRKLAAIELQKRLGVEAWQELSTAEQEARADALIAQGDITLPAKQQEQINALRLLEEEQYLEAVDALYQEQAAKRIELIQDASERERAVFVQGLNERIEELRKAKIEEDEITRFAAAELARFERETAIANIQLDEQIQTARINALQNAGEPEKVFARRKELELLAIKEASAQAQLKLIEGQTGKEAELTRANLELVVAEVNKARQELANNPVKLNLLDLLGIKEEDQQRVKDALSSVLSSAQEIIQAGIDQQAAEVEARISATDEIIADAERRRSELTSLLQQELENQRQGYANNADGVRAEIERVNQAERDATEQRKKAVAERQVLARRQALIDSASQASSIGVAVANLISSWSTLPLGVGLVAAFAQAASIYAFFAKSRAAAKAAAQPDQFEHGGPVEGKRHYQGGTLIEAEAGEYVTNRKSTAKYRGLIEAINEDDLSKLRAPDLAPLLDGLGIKLDDAKIEQVIDARKQEAATTYVANNMRTEALERKVGELTDEVRGLRSDGRNRDGETVLPDGTRVIRKGNQVTRIRRKP
jgi:hypothetical protein